MFVSLECYNCVANEIVSKINNRLFVPAAGDTGIPFGLAVWSHLN